MRNRLVIFRTLLFSALSAFATIPALLLVVVRVLIIMVGLLAVFSIRLLVLLFTSLTIISPTLVIFTTLISLLVVGFLLTSSDRDVRIIWGLK